MWLSIRIALENWIYRCGDMKGFINILELIAVVLAVVIAMSVFFPGFLYSDKWTQAYLLLTGRDILVTIDRTGKLSNYSFSPNDLRQFFSQITPSTNIISWSEVEGTFKQLMVVECNCSADVQSRIASWFGNFTVNGRAISLHICPAGDLSNINSVSACYDPNNPKHTADVLVIWGYTNLTGYTSQLNQFLSNGNGIVEVANFTSIASVDSAQNSIFGLQFVNNNRNLAADYDYFARKPGNSTDVIYGPYKYFFGVPFPESTVAISTTTLNTEGGIPTCALNNTGKFNLNSSSYQFWICSSNSVYFDTDNNGTADTIVSPGQNFTINKAVFTLSSIDFPNRIGIKFNSPYTFNDFFSFQTPPSKDLGASWSNYYPLEVIPYDGTAKNILLNASVGGGQPDIPVVILNNTNGKAAWMADFTDNGNSDDSKNLFFSLVLWSSNKRSIAVLSPSLQVGFLTSYINVNDTDVFEVYRLGIGLGYPY